MASTIYGTDGADSLLGTDGADTINGGLGADTIRGGAGNDLLEGTTTLVYYPSGSHAPSGVVQFLSGPDTYAFGAGFGNDTINEDEVQNTWALQAGWGDDVIRFDADISASSVLLSKVDDTHLRINIAGSTDTILFNVRRAADARTSYGIEFIEFADGTRWNALEQMQTLSSQTLVGSAGSDAITGQDGHDTLTGLAGNDTLTGGFGRDVLTGGQGNDLIVSTTDTTSPLPDQDTIVFGGGDGMDTLRADGQDVLQLGSGLTLSGMNIGARTRQSSSITDNGFVTLSWASGESLTLLDAGSWDGLQIRFADGSLLSGLEVKQAATAKSVQSSSGNDNIIGWFDTNDRLSGLAGADLITANGGNDTLDGGLGNDTLVGGKGADTLTGGKGNDLIVANQSDYSSDGSHNDTVYFNIGDGKDTISINDRDTLVLGAGISSSKLVVGPRLPTAGDIWSGQITLSWGTQDAITLTEVNDIQDTHIQFADGSSLSGQAILNLAELQPRIGTAGADYMMGWDRSNDILRGQAGNDSLIGQTGNDTLEGGSGKDTLNGGADDDRLVGGTGADTYEFSQNSGHDVIVDQDIMPFTNDVIRFFDVNAHRLWFSKSGNDLQINALDYNGSTVTIEGWYASSSNRIEKIIDQDGKTLNASNVNALVTAMSSFAPPSANAGAMDPTAEAQLAATLASNWR